MVKLVDKQNVFNSGILSTKLYSRDDLKQYNNGIADADNFICSRYGPMEKRTGTNFIWDLENPDEKVFFLPFVFSIKQSILLEFLPYKIRFYTFDGLEFGPIADPDNPEYPYEKETPFGEELLDKISYVQSLDVIYLAFSDRKTPPYTLSRYANNNWDLQLFEAEDGPYLDQNYASSKKMTIIDKDQSLSTVTLTNLKLNSADIGRWIRICTPRYNENTYSYEDKWSYGKIDSLGQPVWELDRKTVYTKNSNPVVNEQVYSNMACSVKFRTVNSIGSDESSLYIIIDGKKYYYVESPTSGVYSWKRNILRAYINTEETKEENKIYVYTDSATPGLNQAIYTGEYPSLQQITTTSAGYSIELDTKFIKGNNDEKYYYVTSKTYGSVTKHMWVQAAYVYSDNTYTNKIGSIHTTLDNSAYKVQLYDVSASSASLDNMDILNELGSSSITVRWSFRNFIDEDDNDWMIQPTSEWRLGVWHKDTGNKDYPVTYPTKVTIHQQRLTWAGMTDKPWVWTSNSFAYKNYAPSDYEGEIADTNAIYYDISTDKVSDIFWMKSVKSLLIGTELGEIRMYSSGTAITPADVVSNRESSYGSYNGEPVVNDDTIVFIQRLQRTLRSLSYDYNQDAFVGPELTVLAESLTTGGIKKIVFQKEPNNTYWCLKEDGTLLTMTYDKSQDIIGWSKVKIAGTDSKVIDIAVLPSSVYQQDMLLLAVERRINGQKKRYLELLSKNFTNDVTQKEACFLDCSIHLQSDDSFDYVEGFDFLEGETVRITDEGALFMECKVENGAIQMEYPVKDVWIGLPYKAYFETLERDFQDKQLSTKMSKLRVYKLRMYLDRTIGISIARLEIGSESILATFDPSKDTDEAPSLITGKVTIPVASAWDCDYRLKITSEPGLPCTVSGLIIGVELNEL